MNPTVNIKKLTIEELSRELSGMGMKSYRAAQIHEWLYRNFASSFEEMTNIAKTDRALLAERFFIPGLRLVKQEASNDGTKKFLFQLEDGHTVETVLIPDEDRKTLCISSQVGCAQACRFCLTGSRGFQRNLEAFEIADQVLAVEKMLTEETSAGAAGDNRGEPFRHISNIVLMGMGEPLANFENVVQALRIITGEKGLGFSPRRVTLSTDGLAPEIERLGRTGINVNLAVSLNATTDEIRDRIMPVNKRYPIRELLDACRRYPLDERRRITFEYVLLGGINDSDEDARRLAKLLRGIRSKVNLIPFNPFPGSEFKRPLDQTVRRFQKILLDHHYTAPVRESRGRDISAACGQLREQAAGSGL
jgi:23S rRNA (adenine2503-C2)-methyltransferase